MDGHVDDVGYFQYIHINYIENKVNIKYILDESIVAISDNKRQEQSCGAVTSGDEISRRKMLSTVGAVGTGIGFTEFSSTPASAKSVPETKVVEVLTDDELAEFARTALKRPDVDNVIGSNIRKTVMSGKMVEIKKTDNKGNEHTFSIFTRDSKDVVKQRGIDNLARTDVIVGAARHSLSHGNEMTVATYASGNDRLVTYRKFSTAHDGVRSKARSWNIEARDTLEDSRTVMQKLSVNGEMAKHPEEIDGAANCEGCSPGPSPGGYREQDECVDMDMECAALNCGACIVACTGSGVVGCIVCVTIYCPFALTICCNTWGTTCAAC